MTTEEFLKQDGIKPSSFDNQMRNWSYTESQLLGFAERYHQHKLKLLGITNVVEQSEQLKALEDLKDFAYDNCQPHNSDRLAEIMERL